MPGGVPHLDGNDIARIEPGPRRIHSDADRVAKVERDLPQLIVEKMVGIVAGDQISGAGADQAHRDQQKREPQGQPTAQRYRAGHLGTIQPLPRTFRITSLSNRRRR